MDSPHLVSLGPPGDESIHRAKGTAQEGKSPVRGDQLRAIMAGLDFERSLDVRDRAFLLVGFAWAFRRSELVGLNIEDLEFNDDRRIVHLLGCKTDSEGEGGRWEYRTARHPQPARCGRSKIGCIECLNHE